MSTNSSGGFVKTEQDALNDAQALQLRSLGLTYRQVASRLEVDVATAFRRVQRALAAIPYESVEEYRRLEAERLDAILEMAMAFALSGEKGFLQAIDRCIAIEDRRARLLGLDAPKASSHTFVAYTESELDAEMDRMRRLIEAHPEFE
jgi:hypothetical protein